MGVKDEIISLIANWEEKGIIDKDNKIFYNDKIFSLNDLYSQGHWTKRNSLKNKYRAKFLKLLEDYGLQQINKFYITVFFNTRHDTDNLVGITKVLVDSMKGRYIKEDDRRFYRGLMIFPDETLKPGTLEIHILSKGNGK